MNKQKIKSNAKKTAQYTLVAPFVGVSSALYATVVGMWEITKTTAVVLKAVPQATFKNTVEYVVEIKDPPAPKSW